ncbi:unnamed protein product [Thelazia callipaeda]|uniref:Ferrochelatase n=1 Tax=Thelazia callipaeda TaxID=103827 RepID=A0A0N5CPW3_THECL|nr:unnamed protein product [Thelazia callipaeda]
MILVCVELPKKIGILLVNTGTPSNYSYWSMRRYLKEFLSDPRMIEIPRILWWPILHWFILAIRPFSAGKCYKSIWNMTVDESPLRTVTRSQAIKLADRLRQQPVVVEWAFRYGEPSIASRIQKRKISGCDKLVLFPLFPHFSAATSASVFDETCRHLMKQRRQMALSVVPAFYDNDLYVKSVIKQLNNNLYKFRASPQVIIVSYHGIPLAYQSKGDPYGFQCKYTTALIRKYCEVINCDFLTTFQSRFGPAEWLKPYTEETVVQLAKNGVKRILVIAPGFLADCLETVDELEVELAHSFRNYGGEEFVYVPCLNDSIEGVDVLEALALKHIQCFL